MDKRIHGLGIGLLLGLAVQLTACPGTEPNPEHCWYANGDATCLAQNDGEKPYCVGNVDGCSDTNEPLGCVAQRPSDDCYSPCGGEQLIGDDASCEIAGDGDGDTGDGDIGDGDGDGDTGDGDGDPPACVNDEECTMPGVEFCDPNEGICISCEQTVDPDASCTSLDTALPVCASGGTCVACVEDKQDTCIDETPICDVDAMTCVGCSDHAQCPESACNIAVGSCFDPANIVHVDGDNCGGGDGSEAMPYCTIGEGLANDTLIILHGYNGNVAYQESNTVMGDVAIFASDAEPTPILLGINNSPALSASGNLYMVGLQLSGSPAPGLRVNGGQTWVERSRIINNADGGVVVDGGGLFLESSFVGGSNNMPALHVQDGTADIIYSTLGQPPSVAAESILCEDGSGVTIRNSLLVSFSDSPEFDCPGAVVASSALEATLGDNLALGNMSTDWFTNFVQGDFTLSGSHPSSIETAAIWQTGDPITDIDGDLRPVDDGSQDFAGADLVQ